MKQFLVIGILRLVTGVAQFAVIVLLTAVLSLQELGTYSLLVIFLTYASQVASLSFSTFVLRELGATERAEWPGLLQRQGIFLVGSTALVSVFVVLGQLLGVVQTPSIVWFAILLALTVFNTQHESFLIGAGKAVPAALNLLIRTCWIYCVGIITLTGWVVLDLDIVLMSWVCAELSGAFFVGVTLWRADMLPRRWMGFDAAWVRRGIGVGIQYTLLGLCIIVSSSIQRVMLNYMVDAEAVGIFHFYYVVSVFGPNLLEASLFAILLPKLIATARIRDRDLRLPPIWSFGLLAGLGTAGLLILFFLLPIFMQTLGKPELASHIDLFMFTAGYAIIYTVARVFHYGLYSAKADWWLLLVNGIACAVACLSSLLFIYQAGLNGAAYSLLLTGICLLIGNCLPYWNSALRHKVLARS